MMTALSSDWLLQAALRATLLLAGLLLVWRLLPPAQPGLRRGVLLTACAVLLAAPWMSGWWEFGAPRAVAMATEKTAGGSSSSPFSWPTVLAWIWTGGSLLLTGGLVRESWALRRLIRAASPWRGEAIFSSEENPLPDLRGLTVLRSSSISGPCVAGGRRPVLLLPDSAAAWTPAQWRMVLAHEGQHLRQRDLWLAWLPRLVLCLYWWHPLTHWLRRQFHAESEALCDGAVVSRSGQSPREYVEFLMALNTGRLPAHSAGMAMRSRLGQRIERLLRTPPGPVRARNVLAALVLLAAPVWCALSLRTVQDPAPLRRTATASHPNEIHPAAEDSKEGNSERGEIALRLSAEAFPADQENALRIRK